MQMNKRKFLSLLALLLTAAALLPACAGYEPSKPTDWPELDSEGNWVIVEPTSEGGKTSDPWQEWDKKPCDPADYPLTITELMPKATLPLSDGQVSDWVELYNAGTKEIDLSTMYFCGEAMSGKAAPGYTLVRVSVPNGDKVELRLPDGQLADSLELPKLEKDHAWAKQSDGSFIDTIYATPGGENTMTAYEKLLASEQPGDLRIEEVVVANPEKGGEDWVELYNASSSALDLSNYALSDRGGEKLPLSGSLAPGARVHYVCDGEGASEGTLAVKFGSDGDGCYVYRADGSLSDACLLENIPTGGSYGRMAGSPGFFYFASATPGKADLTGKRRVTPQPVLSPEPGCYDGPVTVTAKVESGVVLRYTTDGSKPNAKSPVFPGSLTVEKPTSLRFYASALDGEMLPAEVLTAPYLTDGKHDLTVVSISLAPDDMWSSKTGIYNQDNSFKKIENEGNVTIFGGDTGNISINCGVSICGSGSRELKKKSFQFKFRSSYGKSKLNYDLFGDGVEEFNSVKLRVGEDYNSAVFRDELVTSIACEQSTTLRYQRYRFAAVYVNGEYFGIFCFRDKIDEHFVAKLENVKKSKVESIIEYETYAEYGSSAGYSKLVRFTVNNDMSKAENYAQVEAQVNIDSLIDWAIAQAYTGNRDYPNERKYKLVDGKWTWVLYDVDWAFYYQSGAYNFVKNGRGEETTRMIGRLFKNATFRARYLERLGEQLRTTYTYEKFAARAEEMTALLESEMPANCQRWGLSVNSWHANVEKMLKFIKERPAELIEQTCSYLSVSSAEAEKYGLK